MSCAFTLVHLYSQAVTGLDLPSHEMKELQKKKLPEAIDNMYLIARRIQARFAQIPNRPVGSIESIHIFRTTNMISAEHVF